MPGRSQAQPRDFSAAVPVIDGLLLRIDGCLHRFAYKILSPICMMFVKHCPLTGQGSSVS
ncbi:hypothetical protein AALO_G00015240 [Alosa alosa]|uniref:Uncharacterized protein n=1 Tax=Alosa alosa TaxID=278164 RepID=A0AAV6HGK0_9TELE|nr:hypothetical protein AALO_G00015240 [Alosa alosa]